MMTRLQESVKYGTAMHTSATARRRRRMRRSGRRKRSVIDVSPPHTHT